MSAHYVSDRPGHSALQVLALVFMTALEVGLLTTPTPHYKEKLCVWSTCLWLHKLDRQHWEPRMSSSRDFVLNCAVIWQGEPLPQSFQV